MKVSYAIMVYNESRELYSLVSFLKKVKDPVDEINILIDTAHVSKSVKEVIKKFESDIVVHNRDFDGDFSAQRNYHIDNCSGEYIFLIDPDEMPQEKLIVNIKKIIEETDTDMIIVPRINICPGATNEWLEHCKFTTNQVGWINWPDYQTRIIKNVPNIRYSNRVHEILSGFSNPINLGAEPSVALWHIKSIEKQENCWNSKGEYKVGETKNLYYELM
jgi:glycosyltransferase involved in cell wall biosynthesis